MEPTDYSRIAERYDRNPIRHAIPADPLVGELLRTGPGPVRVLDLACGTGNYLAAQIGAYGAGPALWTGLDRSPEMLGRARAKNLEAVLVEGEAGALPFGDGAFDLVKVRFAHHHFSDRPAVWAEVFRVLRPGGLVSVFNISPDRQKSSWVHRFFPGTAALDRDKFPTAEGLYHELETAGFAVDLKVTVEILRFPWEELLAEVRNRDMSQLTHLSDGEYRAGLGTLEAEAARGGAWLGDRALLEAVGRKGR